MFEAIFDFFIKNSDIIVNYTLKVPAVMIAILIHELAHSLAAYALGDPTAKEDGRLSLNPFKHIEPVGAVCLYLFNVGWTKPVSTNPKNFKNERLGIFFTSLAGPVANLLTFVLSFAFIMLTTAIRASFLHFGMPGIWNTILLYTINFLALVALFNFVLGVFNLLPIFPLDGSRALMSIIPKRISKPIVRYELFIAIGFIALVVIDRFTIKFLDTSIGIAFDFLSNDVFIPFFEAPLVKIFSYFKLI